VGSSFSPGHITEPTRLVHAALGPRIHVGILSSKAVFLTHVQDQVASSKSTLKRPGSEQHRRGWLFASQVLCRCAVSKKLVGCLWEACDAHLHTRTEGHRHTHTHTHTYTHTCRHACVRLHILIHVYTHAYNQNHTTKRERHIARESKKERTLKDRRTDAHTSPHEHTYTHTHTYTHARTHICPHTHTQTCQYTLIHTLIHVRVCEHIH